MTSEVHQQQREALKAVAVTLKSADLPFALAGSYAAWARGGPESDHDVDFVIPSADRDRALETLRGAGVHSIANTEDWLVKVGWHDVVIDLIWHLPHTPVDAELLGRAETLRVESVEMPVLAASDVLVSKVLAFDEHNCDLAPCLTIARALREQLDLDAMTPVVCRSPFGRAFLDLLVSLEILPPSGVTPPRTYPDSAAARR